MVRADAADQSPRTRVPPRLLPVLYFCVAHVALALACAAVAADPRGVSGFFYHARMLGIVHLVTLGWITASILGSLYIVGPIALRIWIPARWPDYTAFALVLIGVIGMVAHFWLQEYGGMAWSAMTVGSGILIVGAHVASCLRGAPLPRAVSAHIMLAFVNIGGAATLGVLIGFDKVYHFLPGFVLSNVFAHAHLAAIGWASMMVVGMAYRLLPMILPAAMPNGPTIWISAVLLEAGAGGLFVLLLVRSPLVWVAALTVVAGFAAFAAHVVWMLRGPRPRPPGLRRLDPAVLHSGAAFLSLVAAATIGLWLTLAEPSPNTLRAAMAYGVFGLVGFLAQMMVGMEGRVLPMFASQREMPWRYGQDLVFLLWLFGVPSLAGGLALDRVPLVSAGAWCLLIATICDAVNVTRILRHAFTTSA
jgi:hypothetical protein